MSSKSTWCGVVVAAVCLGSGVLASPPAEVGAAGNGPIAFVVGNADRVPANDRPIRDLLEATGRDVVLVSDDDMSDALDVDEVALVVISSSIQPGLFAPAFVDADVSIVTWEYAIADDLLIGDDASESRSSKRRRWIDFVDPGHPIANGRSGATSVFSQPAAVSQAVPAPSAMVVARSVGGTPTIFTYGVGDLLIDGSSAVGCRSFAPLTWASADLLNGEGNALFSAIIDDALGCDPPIVVDEDGDGSPSSVDCDDSDPTVYPGAPEIADDGIDQDCNGRDRTTPTGGEIENVVVIMTDDMSYSDYAHMPKTQDLLGSEGVTFEKFYQNTPVCCPARATLLTGQRSLHHGVNTNKPLDGEGYPAFDNSNTLATWFETAEVDTIHIGKFLNGYGLHSLYPDVQNQLEIPPGWSNFQALVENKKYFDYTLNDNGVLVKYGDGDDEYLTDVLSTRSTDAISESLAAGRNFFMLVDVFAPHTQNGKPPIPAPRHETLFDDVAAPRDPSFNEFKVGDKPGYVRAQPKLNSSDIRHIDQEWEQRVESLQSVDDLVEDVYVRLESEGVLDQTLIVFLSDNGYLLGQHRLIGKIRPYEESIHVPLVMRGGPFLGGEIVDSVVSSTDLAPTIVAQTGITAALVMDGLDLSDVLVAPEVYDNRAIIIEMVEGPGYDAVRTEDWIWIEYYGSGRELYDMVADPYQLESEHKSSGSYASVRGELSEVLDELRTCVGAACTVYANP